MDVKKLKRKVADCRLKEEEMERKLGVEPGAYSDILAGEKGGFTVAQVKQLVVMLGLTPEEAGGIFFR